MIVMFIAVFVVLMALIGVLFLVIRKGIQQLNNKVKEDFFQHLGTYDRHIEEKSKMLDDLRKQLLQMEGQMTITGSEEGRQVEYIAMADNTANYKDADFYENYAMVQTKFKEAAYEAMKEKALALAKERRDLNVHEYREIQQIFTPELQYEILTLPPEEQRDIMATIAQNSVGKKKILEAYSKTHPIFKFKEFMEYIEEYIYRHESLVRIFSHTGEPCIEDAPRQIEFISDPNIAEGYVIRYQDRIYDYSL